MTQSTEITRIHKAKTPVELVDRIYKHHGWTPVFGETRSARIAKLYDLSIDFGNEMIVAVPKKPK